MTQALHKKEEPIKKPAALLPACILLLSAAAALAEGGCPVTIQSCSCAREPIEVTFDRRPEKVICTNQTQTEMLLYLGPRPVSGMAEIP